jgi:hypothetical protein
MPLRFSSLSTTNRRSSPFLRTHPIKDWPGIPPSRQNEKPHYCLKIHSQKIFAKNCVRPAPDPRDYMDFPRYIKRVSLWGPLLATLALLPTNSPQVLGRTSQPTQREFCTPCKKTPSRIQTPGNHPKVSKQEFCTHFTADVQNNTLRRTPRTVTHRKSLINISTITTKFSPGFAAAEYLVLSTFIKKLDLGKLGISSET